MSSSPIIPPHTKRHRRHFDSESESTSTISLSQSQSSSCTFMYFGIQMLSIDNVLIDTSVNFLMAIYPEKLNNFIAAIKEDLKTMNALFFSGSSQRKIPLEKIGFILRPHPLSQWWILSV